MGAPLTLVVTPHINQLPVEQPPLRIVKGNQAQNGSEIVMVPRDQYTDQVLRNVQPNKFEGLLPQIFDTSLDCKDLEIF